MATSAISALGAGSGIDVKALAQSLVDTEKAPRKEAIDKKIAKSEARISGYSAIRFVLDQLKTAFQGLNNKADFNSLSVSNSQTAAFSAIGTSSASSGSHSIVVKTLATAQRSAEVKRQVEEAVEELLKELGLGGSNHAAKQRIDELRQALDTP